MLLLLQVDRDTLDMLKAINMASLPGVTMQQVRPHSSGSHTAWMLICTLP
jgi:hypothetical protein